MNENKTLQSIAAVYFLGLAALMYYFIAEYIVVGVVVTHRHLFALLIVLSGLFYFLIHPHLPRAVVSVKSSLLLSVPLFVTTVVSLVIWFFQTSDQSVITRGIANSYVFMNMATAAFAAGVLLYVFGEKGIWYNLFALLLSNMILIVQVMLTYGFGQYMREFMTLITTFAAQTGEVIGGAELHELAYCVGAYILYMLLRPQKKWWFWVMFVVALFCFLSAFKRIAILAVGVPLLFGRILLGVNKKHSSAISKTLTVAAFVMVLLLIGYIYLIRNGFFEFLEQSGINTMGRADVYELVTPLYNMSPFFMGNGIGFLTYQFNEVWDAAVEIAHNDFLQLYVDLGFIGYIIWLLSMTLLRFNFFKRNGNTEAGIVAFALTLYLFISSTTDNTVNFPLVTSVMAIIMMGHTYDKQVEIQSERTPDYRD